MRACNRLLVLAVVILGMTACHRRRHATGPDTDVGPASSDVDAAGEALKSWDDAHNRHDVAALRGLYAPTVDFYGKQFTAEAVLAVKARAFQRAPDFRQQLSSVRFQNTAGRVRASFEKAWFQSGKAHRVGAAVELAPVDGRLLIVEETDQSVK
jgi:hypothetical protein